MILVLSYSSYEQGTDPVIDWLLYYRASFIKLTFEDLFTRKMNYTVDFVNPKMLINGTDYYPLISTVWCRRFMERVSFRDYPNWPYTQAVEELNRETEAYFDGLYFLLQEKKWLMNPRIGNINKLNVLRVAAQCGFSVPATIITNSKQELIAFMSGGQKVITKPVEFSGFYNAGSYTWAAYTTEVTAAMAAALPEQFVYSLFQARVPAVYEIRVFYLDGACYATAALFDTATRHVDIKENYKADFLHWTNYSLPAPIREKITRLMNKLKLNTGSIDLLMGTDNEYYFLEVNPGGQYSAPSDRGNHYVEKHIAEWLIRQDKLYNHEKERSGVLHHF